MDVQHGTEAHTHAWMHHTACSSGTLGSRYVRLQIHLVLVCQMSAVCAVHGSRLYTLVANLREQLDEMLIIELTLPQDIERMQAAHARAAEQASHL
jgi:hypothetical protein